MARRAPSAPRSVGTWASCRVAGGQRYSSNPPRPAGTPNQSSSISAAADGTRKPTITLCSGAFGTPKPMLEDRFGVDGTCRTMLEDRFGVDGTCRTMLEDRSRGPWHMQNDARGSVSRAPAHAERCSRIGLAGPGTCRTMLEDRSRGPWHMAPTLEHCSEGAGPCRTLLEHCPEGLPKPQACSPRRRVPSLLRPRHRRNEGDLAGRSLQSVAASSGSLPGSPSSGSPEPSGSSVPGSSAGLARARRRLCPRGGAMSSASPWLRRRYTMA
jgi:hypothetical protein